jgi:hypothetical protein
LIVLCGDDLGRLFLSGANDVDVLEEPPCLRRLSFWAVRGGSVLIVILVLDHLRFSSLRHNARSMVLG